MKEHSFFRGLDWKRLKNRQIEPPFRPELYRGFEHIFEDNYNDAPNKKLNYDLHSPNRIVDCPSPLPDSNLEEIPEIESKRVSKPRIFRDLDDGISSKNYSATGGTGEEVTLTRKKQNQSRVLGDYQMSMINKAFIEF